ncbi:NB-ARC domain-containing protein [Caldilinea sp.]|uniref:AfsR/SARP family transcriptional regulator n=1 Tax=Caldilinea sp. TaxID=2293560 RepID=UPI0021DF0FE1|nr:NB-ARC domain-containing protein [Caldilinea sp.]GIV67435.1 MAG: SARP family transcriptional regulator [Caldilinea sp.]
MLDFKLLGAPHILLDGQPLTLRRNSVKARALLFYLAATGAMEPRDRLAGLLWSDWPETKARAYLRGELHLLSDLKNRYLLEAEGRIGLAAERVHVDLQALRRVIASPSPTLEELYAASRLYTGPFLDGLDAQLEESSPLFVEWMQVEREQIERQWLQLLYRFAAACAGEGRMLTAGIDACTHLLELEPEREEVHRLKMRLLAMDGQRAAALKQYDLCASALMDELGVPVSAETDALYDRILAGEFDRFERAPIETAGPTGRRSPFQAIAAPAQFSGRDQELDQLIAWLTRPGRPPVVAIVGMGGVGKTALAAAVAERLRPHFADGVLWGRVATDAPLDILQSWALAYDRDLSKITGLEARAAAMRAILADKQALIVLDDVIAGKPIDALLPGAAPCAVLLTSRDRAEIAPHAAEILELRELSPESSLEMLTHLLGEATIAAERASAEELCRLLEGLPLAVEIAAQRIVSSPRRDLARMVRNLRSASARLAHGISNRSVRTSFEVSWASLGAPLRRTFTLLGLFDGRPFTAEAVAAVGELSLDDAIEQLDHLTALSMLKFAGEERYVQHRLLADFAAEKLAELPDRALLQQRFVAYYRRLVQAAAGHFDRLHHEWHHLLNAIETAQQLQEWNELLALVDAAAAPWFARGRFHDARKGFMAGLEAARALNDAQHSTRFAFFLGRVALRQDDYPAACALLQSAIAGYEESGNTLRMADALIDLADVEIELGDHAAAQEHLRRAEASYAAHAQSVGLAAVRCRQASIAYDQEAFDRAAALCEDGLRLLPPEGGELVRSRILRLLADIAVRKQALELAQHYTRQAQEVSAVLNDQTENAAILFAQAKLAHYFGNEIEALESAQQSLALYTAMGDRKAAAVIHLLLCRIYRALGDEMRLGEAVARGKALALEVQDAYIAALFESFTLSAPLAPSS